MAVTKIDGGKQIRAATITNAEIAAAAGIVTTKLADSANFILRGGTVAFTADQAMGGFKITGLGTPTATTDAATKAYVDAAAVGIDWKASVRAATTAAGTLATSFENTDVIDGVTLATGDRILIKDQASGGENGIYIVAASGAPTRAPDADTAAEVTAGMAVFVEEGTTNADTGWVMTNNGAITLGSTALVFTQFSGSGALTAGSGLTKTGNTVDFITLDTSLIVAADSVKVNLALWITRETPTGLVNGANTTYTLANTPVVGSEQVFLNGILQEPGAGNDYTIATTTITYLTAPISGDIIRVNYIKSP